MRRLAAAAAVATFVAVTATAQMKVPSQPAAKPQPAATSTSPVQIQMNNPSAALNPEKELESARRIGREEAIKLVKEGKGVFVDVRSKESYDADHIKGAISIPLSEVQARMGELPKNKMIITYCA